MAKDNKKYKDVWFTQTDIAKLYCMNSITLGKTFKKVGIKLEDGSVSDFAKNNGFVTEAPYKAGIKFYMYHKENIINLLSENKIFVSSKVDQFVFEIANEFNKNRKNKEFLGNKIEDIWADSVRDRMKVFNEEEREEINTKLEEQISYKLN